MNINSSFIYLVPNCAAKKSLTLLKVEVCTIFTVFKMFLVHYKALYALDLIKAVDHNGQKNMLFKKMKIIKFGPLVLHFKKKYEAKSKPCITQKLIQFFCCHFSAPDDNFPQCWRTFLHHSPLHAFERRRFHVSCNVQWAIQTRIGQRRKIFY